MPIEIKELHIKINVDSDKSAGNTDEGSKQDKDSIVRSCVEQVMHLIAMQKER